MTSKVAFYLRSATENLSDIQKQNRSLQKNLERFGLTNSRISIYCDVKQSGMDCGPEFLRLKNDILAGNVDVVCVARLNRISRSMKGLSNFLNLVRDSRVRFISPHENIDSNFWNLNACEVKNENL
jgi:DNA invertase Pin-like site-specific DNA recombinase